MHKRGPRRDDYYLDIPASDADPHRPIVALMPDGAPLDPEMMGPYWIVYPYDSDPAYQGRGAQDRSI
jgi:hypothetical protein